MKLFGRKSTKNVAPDVNDSPGIILDESNIDPELLKLVRLKADHEAKIASLVQHQKELEESIRGLETEKKGLQGEVKSFRDQARKEANADADTIRKDAKEEAKTIREEAKTASAEANASVKEKKSELSAKEKDLNNREKRIVKKEEQLLDRERNAENGFQTELAEEIRKRNEILEGIESQIHQLKIDREKTESAIQAEVAQYRKDLFAAAEGALQELKNEAEEKANKARVIEKEVSIKLADVEEREHRVEVKEGEVKAKEELYNTRYSQLQDKIAEGINHAYSALIEENQELSDKLSESEEELTSLRKEANELSRQCLEAEEELQEIRQGIGQGYIQDQEIRKENELLRRKLVKLYGYGDIEALNTKAQHYDEAIARALEAEKDRDEARRALNERADNSFMLQGAEAQNDRLKEAYRQVCEELDARKEISKESRMYAITRDFQPLNRIRNLDTFPEETKELDWLAHVISQADKSGIRFDKRLWKAYHTSLKISEWSPLVVFAGVSGTGKSELPRQYAQHGGLHFLSIPVKPDWDSPSSLFGFYNSIENKFEATELLKALYHMQSLVDKKLGNQMLLVLLDEMNLAHIELYFSDLLSKFETRRGSGEGAKYDIELGAGADPETLIIDNNILWTGTMNEDETTKALSDKVIDRSTLVTFPRPDHFEDRGKVEILETEKVLTKSLWNRWLNQALSKDEFGANRMDELRVIVEQINAIMGDLGRNLGHRTWQGIQNYLLNHPDVIAKRGTNEMNTAINQAFAEAVAFKIMPKLRGVEVNGDYSSKIKDIGEIIKDNVGLLYEDYQKAITLPSGIFQWCSAYFLTQTKQ